MNKGASETIFAGQFLSMQTSIHNWYWARASVGPSTVIASYITATAGYGMEDKAWRQVEKRNFNLRVKCPKDAPSAAFRL
ncbi:MAG TPA: hypothetical protein VNU19_23625 [Candidatus Acidoferrum sp.]|nr:hypothetical protein [Candidatus Acidoferrum sp.]